MTTKQNAHRQALLVIDVQNGVVAGAHDRAAVLDTIVGLVARARAAGVAVIWIQHHDEDMVEGSPEWQWVDGFGPTGGEPCIQKAYGDSFAGTDLETVLDGLGVGEVVLTGAATEQCIRCTLHGAVIRGYDAALVKGGHTTVDLTGYGMPDPATVIGFVDLIAQYGMSWPGSAGRSVTPGELFTG